MLLVRLLVCSRLLVKFWGIHRFSTVQRVSAPSLHIVQGSTVTNNQGLARKKGLSLFLEELPKVYSNFKCIYSLTQEFYIQKSFLQLNSQIKNIHVIMCTEILFIILKDWKLFLDSSLRDYLINIIHTGRKCNIMQRSTDFRLHKIYFHHLLIIQTCDSPPDFY